MDLFSAYRNVAIDAGTTEMECVAIPSGLDIKFIGDMFSDPVNGFFCIFDGLAVAAQDLNTGHKLTLKKE